MIEYTRTALQALLDALEDGSRASPLALPVMPAPEYRQVIESFNATRVNRAQGVQVHELFEQQAERTASAVAVIYGARCVTYSDLNRRANQLARY
jgi:non-ribosomal peptide synthetase component F